MEHRKIQRLNKIEKLKSKKESAIIPYQDTRIPEYQDSNPQNRLSLHLPILKTSFTIPDKKKGQQKSYMPDKKLVYRRARRSQ